MPNVNVPIDFLFDGSINIYPNEFIKFKDN